jgi:hypothetical protein
VNGFKTLSSIKKEANRLAALVGVGPELLPTFGHSEDLARPHIEVDATGYHFVVVERGKEQSRHTTTDFDDLLYQIFQDVTFALAINYELAHRVERRDCRRLIFQRQVELLSQLSNDWGRRRATKHRTILRLHPFDDLSSERATLTAQLRKSGHSPEDAWRMACKQYPKPRARRTKRST